MKKSILLISMYLITIIVIITACSINNSETVTSNYSKTTNKSNVEYDDSSVYNYSSKSEIFTNEYGTSTTICEHSGCTNYIAKSGNTNCCVIHSNKCLECGCYIDEDAMYCLSCIKNTINDASKSYHVCEVSGCYNEGEYSIEGLNGTLEYYCYKHYNEMLDMYGKMFG